MTSKLDQLIQLGVREGYSDLHITGGHPLVYRYNGVIHSAKDIKLSHQEVDNCVLELLTQRELSMLRSRLSVDLARSIHRVRVRINVFNTTRGLSLAVRLLPGTVPELGSINIHPSLQHFTTLSEGLILLCGPTGCGKSTTIAAMLEEINRTRSTHIITLEDPIEYRFTSKKSFIEQRELGVHFPSYKQGLIDVLREDPDVIVVGELREPEVMRLTLNAVESGHLVFATLHATNSEDALYRISNSFPPEAQAVVRNQLASTLALLVVQKLIYLKRAGFRVPLLSILRSTNAIKTIIRDDKLSYIEGAMQTGRSAGMFTTDKYMSDFINKREFFTKPTENFKPSTEVASEMIYRSPVMEMDDIDVQTAIPAKEPRAHPSLHMPAPSKRGETKKPVDYGYDHWDTGSHYTIDEEAPIMDLIAEMTK